MQALKKTPFFLLLLPLFFCLNGGVDNIGFISASELLVLGLKILAGIALFFAIVYLFYRRYLAAALIVFFISFWYLFFGALHDLIKNTDWLSFIKSYTVLLPLLLLLSILFALWLSKHPKYWQRLTLYLNVLLLLYCMLDTVRFISKTVLSVPQKAYAPVNFDTAKVKAKPNVYLIILDEYAGRQSLSDSFHFGNDSFYNSLQQLGFTAMPATSNYNFTVFSMSSLLNMRYIDRRDNTKDIVQYDYLARMDEIKDAEAFSIFSKMGYEPRNFSIFDVGDKPAINADYDNELVPRHTTLLTDKILHNRADRDIGWGIPAGIKKWLPFFKNRSFYNQQKDNTNAIDSTRALALHPHTKPTFSYTHILMPHWPYYFDSSGKANPESQILPVESWRDKSLYLGYLQYGNRVITQLLTGIVQNDSSAMILVLSDHGFRNYNDTRHFQPLQFNAFCAVRMPGIQSAPFNRSHVNFFPWFFNTAFNQQLPYRQDSCVALVDDQPFN